MNSSYGREYVCFPAEPLPLMDLCRRVIRQQVGRANIDQGKLE